LQIKTPDIDGETRGKYGRAGDPQIGAEEKGWLKTKILGLDHQLTIQDVCPTRLAGNHMGTA
jgi:hypothetical protein